MTPMYSRDANDWLAIKSYPTNQTSWKFKQFTLQSFVISKSKYFQSGKRYKYESQNIVFETNQILEVQTLGEKMEKD